MPIIIYKNKLAVMGNCAGLSRDETMESLHGPMMNQQIASLEGMRLMQKNPKSS